MMKKRICLMAFFTLMLTLASTVQAQQLTRFAVVDLTRVYASFFRESRAVREFEEKSSRIQADIDMMTAEIQDLKSQQLSAEMQGDRTRSLRLDAEVSQKSEFLRNYYSTRSAELENQRRALAQSSSFLDQVNSEVQLIAESEGYTMVLNLKENNAIIWYSPAVDITDKVIQGLLTKAGR
jgi:outer membrane protein